MSFQHVDGKLNEPNFLEMAEVLTEGNDKKMKYIRQFLADCNKDDGDRCEKAFLFTKCLHDKVSEVMHEDFDIV